MKWTVVFSLIFIISAKVGVESGEFDGPGREFVMPGIMDCYDSYDQVDGIVESLHKNSTVDGCLYACLARVWGMENLPYFLEMFDRIFDDISEDEKQTKIDCISEADGARCEKGYTMVKCLFPTPDEQIDFPETATVPTDDGSTSEASGDGSEDQAMPKCTIQQDGTGIDIKISNMPSLNHPSSASSNLFSPDELKSILSEVMSGLSTCHSKADQFKLITTLAIKYLYTK